MANNITTEAAATPRLLLPFPDAQATVGVGRTMLYELASRGEIELVRVGRRVLVVAASLDAYVERLRREQKAPAA